MKRDPYTIEHDDTGYRVRGPGRRFVSRWQIGGQAQELAGLLNAAYERGRRDERKRQRARKAKARR